MNLNYHFDISYLNGLFDLIKKQEEEKKAAKKAGDDFNYFKILNVATDEVRICRVLYELLNPNGLHGQDDTYLKLFFEYVLKEDYKGPGYTIKREFLIKNDRRIDLLIFKGNEKYPIKVKIYAEDQKNQIYDYYDEYKKRVYYLTLDGHEPSYDSLKLKKNPSDKEIKESQEKYWCISFKKDIYNWLIKCKKETKNKKIKAALDMLINNIMEITNKMNEKEVKNIIEVLDEDKIIAIKKAEEAIRAYRETTVSKFLEKFREKLEEKCIKNSYYVKDEINEKWKKDDKKWISEFSDGKNKFPAVSYVVYKNKELCVSVRLVLCGNSSLGDDCKHGCAYVEIVCTNKDFGWAKLGEELRDKIGNKNNFFIENHNSFNTNNKGKHVIVASTAIKNKDKSPNFFNINNELLNMDDKAFNKYIDCCVECYMQMFKKIEDYLVETYGEKDPPTNKC